MPVNRNALIRYKTIDKCLQNHYRQWTLNDLIDACSDALYEYEGIDKGISKRTVQLDIQMMRSDKLGYNAPIVAYDNKYYKYDDETYSITNIPLNDSDLTKLTEAVEFMKQFKGFSHFTELEGMVHKLEDMIYSQKVSQKPVIDFEKNNNLKGIEYLDTLYKAIVQQKAIALTYQSFKARQPSTFIFHAYLLKEFRNRWFVIGRRKSNQPIVNLALDRIGKVEDTEAPFQTDSNFDAELYFKDTIGASVSPTLEKEKVVLFVIQKHAPYVITKPFHHSQKVIEKNHFGITISLDVQLNFELEKEILGLGEGVMVLSPNRLRRSIRERLETAAENYQTDISDRGLQLALKILNHKGYTIIHRVFTQRSLKQIRKRLHKYGLTNTVSDAPIELLEDSIPELQPLVINKNISRLLAQTKTSPQPKSLLYLPEGHPDFLNWNQSTKSNSFCMLFLLPSKSQNSVTIELFPGSHKKELSKAEQTTLIENSLPTNYELDAGSAFLFHPLLFKMVSNSIMEKGIRGFLVRFE